MINSLSFFYLFGEVFISLSFLKEGFAGYSNLLRTLKTVAESSRWQHTYRTLLTSIPFTRRPTRHCKNLTLGEELWPQISQTEQNHSLPPLPHQGSRTEKPYRVLMVKMYPESGWGFLQIPSSSLFQDWSNLAHTQFFWQVINFSYCLGGGKRSL